MSCAGPLTRSRRRKSRKYQWLQWRETSSAPDSDGGRTSAAHHVGGVRRYPRTEISKFQIARCQFAELKIELTIDKSTVAGKHAICRCASAAAAPIYRHVNRRCADVRRCSVCSHPLPSRRAPPPFGRY